MIKEWNVKAFSGLLRCPNMSLKLIESAFEMRSMCFLHTCSTQLRFTMTLREIWVAFTNLIVMVHVVAMEIATLKGCREAFVLLNGRKE